MENWNATESEDAMNNQNELNQWVRSSVNQAGEHKKTDITYTERSFLEEEENEKINVIVDILFKKINEDYSWQCRLKEYLRFHIEQKVDNLLAEEMDILLKDFFKKELTKSFSNRQIRIDSPYNFDSSAEVEDKKTTFLPGIVNQNAFVSIEAAPDNVTLNLEPETGEMTKDFSDTNAAEKIVFLYQLGIIDFLRTQSPFNVSTNKLAKAISTFTGIRQTTVQSYINPMISKDVVSKNNPLKEKTLAMVKQKLTKLGYQG